MTGHIKGLLGRTIIIKRNSTKEQKSKKKEGINMKTKKSFKSTVLLAVIFTFLLAVASGCGEDSSLNSSAENTSLSVMLDNSAVNPAEITITEAKALITALELETEPSGTSQYIRITPFVIYFNIGGAVITVTSGNLPGGTWNKIKFKIHKPEDTEQIPDPEFREGTSGSQRYSFIIKGTYNGNNFVYKSRKSVNMIINLVAPIVTGNGSRNITMIIDPGMWFKNGTVIIDPLDPDNENIIDDNIKNSFRRAFKDDDKNGQPDDN